MFTQTNDRLINLRNVSNINIVKEQNRIIFNMNYNTEISVFSKKTNTDTFKLISDYVYWDCTSEKDVNDKIEEIQKNEYFVNNFIVKIDGTGYINVQEISSVKFIDKKYRVIFNLSHPVTYIDYDGNEKMTSEFIYVNCKDAEQYNMYSMYVRNELS